MPAEVAPPSAVRPAAGVAPPAATMLVPPIDGIPPEPEPPLPELLPPKLAAAPPRFALPAPAVPLPAPPLSWAYASRSTPVRPPQPINSPIAPTHHHCRIHAMLGANQPAVKAAPKPANYFMDWLYIVLFDCPTRPLYAVTRFLEAFSRRVGMRWAAFGSLASSSTTRSISLRESRKRSL